MTQAMQIINGLIKIQERSDAFRHGREELFEGINLAEVHCIDRIGMIDYANVTKIAGQMGMTRGAISKISKKLLAKGLIESYQRPENNKEIYYRLTEGGRQLYDAHKECHGRSIAEKLSILEGFSDDEQAVILRFLDDINRMLEIKLADATPSEE